ncbi:conserved hypothetical protein [Agrobacterium tumefaciens str. B6]|uniref:Uncharacterized protein n=1 Tax=Agrobacterium tumefaciens str. B6 TaxID=1183423 RepID=A0A822V435_AGRTU|nr:conserved hypothetical protein [Agrobacterium tumefaciens str. B6]
MSAVIAGFGIGTGAWNACDGVKLVRNTTIAVATLVVRKFIMIFLRLLRRVEPRLFTQSLLSEIWDSPLYARKEFDDVQTSLEKFGSRQLSGERRMR